MGGWYWFRHFTLRHARRFPSQSLLVLLTIALGVATVVSIRLANRAALQSFTVFAEAVTGGSDLSLRPASGAFSVAELREMRDALGELPVVLFPLIETSATIISDRDDPTATGPSLRLLGIDVVAAGSLLAERGARETFFTNLERDPGGDFWAAFRSSPGVFLSPEAGHLVQGDGTLSLLIGDRPHEVRILGRIPETPGAGLADRRLAVMDLPDLQHLLGRGDTVDGVELIIDASDAAARIAAAAADRLRAAGERRWVLEEAAFRQDTGRMLTRSYRLNLGVLALVALLVGLSLVLQGLGSAVERRREESAILRSLGVSDKRIQCLWLSEGALFGLAGGALGCLLGWAGAQFTVRLVADSINTLYFQTTVRSADPAGFEAVLALLLGLGAGLVAGWIPAREAARTPPAQHLGRASSGAGLPRPTRLAAATAALAVGVLGFILPPLQDAAGNRFPLAGYAAAFAWILAGSLLTPFLLPLLGRIAGGFRAGAVRRVMAGQLRQAGARHRQAVAGVVMAVGMTASMLFLIGSFESTVRGWIGQVLQGDVFASPAAARGAGSGAQIAPETLEAIAARPGVHAIAPHRVRSVLINGREVTLGGRDLSLVIHYGSVVWLRPPPAAFFTSDEEAPALAAASESLALRLRLQPGDRLRLPLPGGDSVETTIAGIYADYGDEAGSLLIDQNRLQAWFGPTGARTLAIHLEEDVGVDAFIAGLAADHPGLRLFSNRDLREEALQIFRRTFAVTYALLAIGLVVAIAGLGLGLATLLLERRHELGVLRVLGFSPREIAHGAAGEGLALAAAGVCGGLLLGGVLGLLLIHVINRQSFGWTLLFHLPAADLLQLALILLSTAALAAYLTGLRAPRAQ